MCNVQHTCLHLQVCPLSVEQGRLVCYLLVLKALEGIPAFVLPILQPVAAVFSEKNWVVMVMHL